MKTPPADARVRYQRRALLGDQPVHARLVRGQARIWGDVLAKGLLDAVKHRPVMRNERTLPSRSTREKTCSLWPGPGLIFRPGLRPM